MCFKVGLILGAEQIQISRTPGGTAKNCTGRVETILSLVTMESTAYIEHV
jgi:hypothetical protein